ncbi:MAG: hypothetical protein U0166_26665 [Acidobacteriota bacterium]
MTQGRIAGLPHKRARLRSRAGNRVLETCDEHGAWDGSGLVETVVLTGADVPDLRELHERRTAGVGALRPCDERDPLSELEAIESTRVERLVELGLARFIDAARNDWRHTFKGALLVAFRGQARQLEDARAQMDGRAS